MLATCAASLRLSSASIVTVAGWSTLTLPTSDSLRGATSCIELRSLRTAKEVLEDPEVPDPLEPVEAPAPPAPAALAPTAEDPDPEAPEEAPAEEALVVPFADTASPTSPESETSVPLWGARSLVSASASSSLRTVSLSLFTAALAEAMLASRSAGLTVALAAVEVDSAWGVLLAPDPALPASDPEPLVPRSGAARA